MKLVLKIAGGLVLLLVLVIGGFAAYINATWEIDHSAVEKPAIRASQDPEVIKRGEYLAHSVAHCSICHATYETTMARKPGEHPAMAGGFEWKMGPMGTLYSRNITPDVETGIGAWSDEELARAIKWGVGRDGKLLTFMTLGVPAMADEDVQAIISYLRSTPAVRQENKPHDPGLLLKWLAKSVGPDFRKPFVADLRYVAESAEPSLERGKYLAQGPAWCVGCHTPFDMMEMKVSGPLFSGSDEGEPGHGDPDNAYRSPNLTPDAKTGHITTWTEDAFLARFRAGRVYKGSKMPWEAYREMSDSDLRSVFRYLRSLPPTQHYIGPTVRKADEDPREDAAAKALTQG